VILDAPDPWGPFSFVARQPYFGPSNGYDPAFPIKWISRTDLTYGSSMRRTATAADPGCAVPPAAALTTGASSSRSPHGAWPRQEPAARTRGWALRSRRNHRCGGADSRQRHQPTNSPADTSRSHTTHQPDSVDVTPECCHPRFWPCAGTTRAMSLTRCAACDQITTARFVTSMAPDRSSDMHCASARRSRSHSRCGRAGELSEVSGELLLVTFAEVAPDNAALRRHHRLGVCNLNIRLAPETRGRASSPKDDKRACSLATSDANARQLVPDQTGTVPGRRFASGLAAMRPRRLPYFDSKRQVGESVHGP
jgi:hypothetical protein